MLGRIWTSVRNNHFAQMAICCALPVVAIIGLQLAGIREWWVYPFALLLCLGGHSVMMFFSRDAKERKVEKCH